MNMRGAIELGSIDCSQILADVDPLLELQTADTNLPAEDNLQSPAPPSLLSAFLSPTDRT